MQNLSRKKWSLFLLSFRWLLALTISSALFGGFSSLRAYADTSTFNASADSQEEEESQYRYRFRLQSPFSLTGTPPHSDAVDHGHSELSEAKLKENQKKVIEYIEGLRKSGTKISRKETVEIYHLAEDFGVVHSLLGYFITEKENKDIGRSRQEIHEEVIENLVRKNVVGKRLGINDFGSGETNAKTDVDFTPLSEGMAHTGAELVKAYNEEFGAVTKKYGRLLNPGQTDIVAHKYEATFPDWRQSMAAADFAVELRTGMELLRANPEAYFLEGAYLKEVMGRSTAPGDKKTVTWYALDEEGKVQKEHVHAAEVAEFFYRPDVRARYAWGTAVGNWHFYNAHPEDKAAQAKYLIRSANRPDVEKRGEYENLTNSERSALVKKMYGNRFTPESLKQIKAALDTARNIRMLKSDKTQTLDMTTPEGQVKAYKPMIDYERSRSSIEVSDVDLLKLAIYRYERTSQITLVENNISTAKHRLKDWLAPRLSTSDIPERAMVGFDEDGNAKKIKIDPDMVTRLNFSAFFELKAAMSLMDDAMISRIQDANPKYHNDIAVLKRLIKKQNQMMTAPDELSPEEALLFRKTAAQQVDEDINRIKKILKSRGRTVAFIEAGKTMWNRGNEFESWLQRATIDKLVSIPGGGKYLPMLGKLRNAVDATSERLGRTYDPTDTETVKERCLSPKWIARLDKGTSVIEVLKVYAKEGEINESVLMSALYEGLSFAPGFGTLFALQGGVQGIATLTFVQLIPGYAPMLVTLNFAKGGVELAGMMVFEPLKRDKILLAYQGFLDPEAGGIITSGQRERVNSPRPALLHPVDPHRKLSLDERREKMYQYLHKKVLVKLKNDPDIWYGPEDDPNIWYGPQRFGFKNLHEKYRDKELEHMSKVVDQYVEDWWAGQGDFEFCDECINIHGPDIRAELKYRLKQDYVKGWNIAIEKDIEKQEAERERFEKESDGLIGMDIAIDEEGRSKGLTNDYKLAGETVMAYALHKMPVLEPSVEIIAAPRVETEPHPDPEKDEELDVVNRLNLRAKITGSVKTNPGPWRVKWEVKAIRGVPIKFDEPDEHQTETIKNGEEPFTDGGTIQVTAYAIDANGIKFGNGSINIQIEKTRIDVKKEDVIVDVNIGNFVPGDQP